MRRLVFDCETDGLLDDLTRIHSLVIEDLDTGEFWSCTNDGDRSKFCTIERGLELLTSAEVLYAHNGLTFDIPALQKVYPSFKPRGRLLDTLVLANLRFAHIGDLDYAVFKRGGIPGTLIGSHKLEAWGYRLGILKGDFGKDTDWQFWSVAMQRYCERDVKVTVALVRHLLKRGGVTEEAIETEHSLAEYLHAQERNGFPFHREQAEALYATLTAKLAASGEQLRGVFGSWLAPNGETTPKKNNKKRGILAGCPYTKLKVVEFNPGSRQHIAKVLQVRYGWQPSEFTETGQVKVDDEIIGRLPYPEAKPLTEYLTLKKRIGQIGDGDKAWLRLAKPHPVTGCDHIHGRTISIGAVTHRGAHSNPNLAQVPKVTSPFGPECRSLFIVPPGWVMLGADASGLELRCLAHYMARHDGGAYAKIILEGDSKLGTDIHSVNRNALGLEGAKGRDDAKTFIYAFLYGAGDELIGAIVAPLASPEQQRRIGKKLRARFLKNLPALGYLVDGVKAKTRKNGFFKLIDGRRVYTRSEHSALNFLLQGTGAVICKRWIFEFNRRFITEFGPQGWHGKWAALAWVHDEVQIAVRPEIADRAATIVVESIRAMTDHFSFRCPLDGEAKLGPHWAATH